MKYVKYLSLAFELIPYIVRILTIVGAVAENKTAQKRLQAEVLELVKESLDNSITLVEERLYRGESVRGV